jgi:hypothetical protein
MQHSQQASIEFSYRAVSELLINNGFPVRSLNEQLNNNMEFISKFQDYALENELYSDLAILKKRDIIDDTHVVYCNSINDGKRIQILKNKPITLMELAFIYKISGIDKSLFNDLIETIAEREKKNIKFCQGFFDFVCSFYDYLQSNQEDSE